MANKQEVRVRIKSMRYEVEASLFSEEEGVLSRHNGTEVEPETVHINTLGVMKQENGRAEISYEETEATGMDGSTTTVSYLLDQPEVVSMIREGVVSTALVFEAGKRHHCMYRTPFMPFEVCVHTSKVVNRLSEATKTLMLDYVIEIRGARAERTKFYMEIL